MAVENLDELVARASRRATATWGPSYVEHSATYVWQPETVMYYDDTTGAEVWKITDTPNLHNLYHSDIGFASWSADGKRLAFASPRETQAFTAGPTAYKWMLVQTNGSSLRPAVEAAGRYNTSSTNPYFHWSPQEPDVFFEVANEYWPNAGVELYRSVVSDSGITKAKILEYPEAVYLNKSISSDGKKVIAFNRAYYPGAASSVLYPSTVVGVPAVDVPAGYSYNRDTALYGNMAAPADNYRYYHDVYYRGLGDWLYCMIQQSSVWWRNKVLGTAADGGPLWTMDDGSHVFGECWPENQNGAAHTVGNLYVPFARTADNSYDPATCAYWSHVTPDRWGRYVNHQGATSLPVWDVTNHAYGATQNTAYGGTGTSSHTDWAAFSDWAVTSNHPVDGGAANTQRVYAFKYNVENSFISVCRAYPFYYGGTLYADNIRPFQSPDGTKVAFHSEFLNAANKVDCFWSVVCYPYPPTDLAASGTGAAMVLKWLPPTYTSRRWINRATNVIDEVNGEVLYGREIRRYHVWRSTTGTDGWTLIGSTTAYYANNGTTNTLMPLDGVAGSEVDASHKVSYTDAPGNGTWYYAVTAEEHSGLESDGLSEILEVVVSGGNVTSTTVAAVKGQADFWTTAPSAPSALSVDVPVGVLHYVLTWTEPVDTKVRYYNLYYSSTGVAPTADKQHRIVSVPAGTTVWRDWLIDLAPTGAHIYGLTAVDRYGNESSLITGSPPEDDVPDEGWADSTWGPPLISTGETSSLSNWVADDWSIPVIVMQETVAPAFASATINAAGDTLTVVLTEAGSPPVLPASGATGFSLSDTTATVTTGTFSTVTGTFTLTGKVYSGETVTLSYTPGNVTDSATSPNALAAFSGAAVTNNSTVENVAPTFTSANVNDVGTTLRVGFAETGSPPVLPASGATGFTLKADGVAVSTSNWTRTGTDPGYFTATIARTILSTETTTLDYAPGNVTDSETPPNALAAFAGETVTNGSTQSASVAGGIGFGMGGFIS